MEWIPTICKLPKDIEPKIIQVAELPEPTYGRYKTEDGKWEMLESCFVGEDYQVIAWQDLPQAYSKEMDLTRIEEFVEAKDNKNDSLAARLKYCYQIIENGILSAIQYSSNGVAMLDLTSLLWREDELELEEFFIDMLKENGIKVVNEDDYNIIYFTF